MKRSEIDEVLFKQNNEYVIEKNELAKLIKANKYDLEESIEQQLTNNSVYNSEFFIIDKKTYINYRALHILAHSTYLTKNSKKRIELIKQRVLELEKEAQKKAQRANQDSWSIVTQYK